MNSPKSLSAPGERSFASAKQNKNVCPLRHWLGTLFKRAWGALRSRKTKAMCVAAVGRPGCEAESPNCGMVEKKISSTTKV
jgi:hypothetical protein